MVKQILHMAVIGRSALVVWTMIVLVAVVATGIDHITALVSGLSEAAFKAEIALDDDVAVILVAYGVILETREMLAEKTGYPEHPGRAHAINELSEVYGAVILIMGLVMEVIDQSFEPLFAGYDLHAIGLGVMTVCDVLSAMLCIVYAWRLLTLSKEIEA